MLSHCSLHGHLTKSLDHSGKVGAPEDRWKLGQEKCKGIAMLGPRARIGSPQCSCGKPTQLTARTLKAMGVRRGSSGPYWTG